MRVPVANVAFDNVTMAEAVASIVEMTQQKDKARYVCTGNLDHLVTLDRDAEFRSVYLKADLVLADGAPVLWMSRLAPGTETLRERVAGSDLFWELSRVSEETGMRLFFLGGAPGAADRAVEAVKRRYPNVQIVGTYCPPFETFSTEAEQTRIRTTVQAARPDVLMVAFGAPKQEKWIAANKDLLGVPVSIGVGGSFEMAGGNVRRAPMWMQRAGMEWAWRFGQEPSRLFKRYFMKDIPFLAILTIRTLLNRSRPAANAGAS